jgi:probable rRNA maturation factor
MTLIADVANEGVRVPLSTERVAAIARAVLRAEGVRDALLSITFLDARAMARLNQRHLRHRGPTDVISFAFDRSAPRSAIVGDVYICPDVAKANAANAGVGVREEIARLVVHGTLHVLGYDHPDGEARERSAMWKRQETHLARAARRALTAR